MRDTSDSHKVEATAKRAENKWLVCGLAGLICLLLFTGMRAASAAPSDPPPGEGFVPNFSGLTIDDDKFGIESNGDIITIDGMSLLEFDTPFVDFQNQISANHVVLNNLRGAADNRMINVNGFFNILSRGVDNNWRDASIEIGADDGTWMGIGNNEISVLEDSLHLQKDSGNGVNGVVIGSDTSDSDLQVHGSVRANSFGEYTDETSPSEDFANGERASNSVACPENTQLISCGASIKKRWGATHIISSDVPLSQVRPNLGNNTCYVSAATNETGSTRYLYPYAVCLDPLGP